MRSAGKFDRYLLASLRFAQTPPKPDLISGRPELRRTRSQGARLGSEDVEDAGLVYTSCSLCSQRDAVIHGAAPPTPPRRVCGQRLPATVPTPALGGARLGSEDLGTLAVACSRSPGTARAAGPRN